MKFPYTNFAHLQIMCASLKQPRPVTSVGSRDSEELPILAGF